MCCLIQNQTKLGYMLEKLNFLGVWHRAVTPETDLMGPVGPLLRMTQGNVGLPVQGKPQREIALRTVGEK